jgi:uncharacterized protein YbjT (DUF2867 family)
LTSVLVTGPAGTLGSALIPRLVARGHDVRVLVHATAVDCLPAVQVVPGDVRNGTGLLEAVAGVDAVIHAATSPFHRARATEIEGTRHVLLAADSVNAHFVYPSIVGVDQIGGTYYQAKWMAEQIVETAKRWTIQRGTQFHPMIDRMLSHHLFPATSRMAFQPLDASEFADHLIDLVEEGPAGRAEDFGGPEVLALREMVTARKTATKHHTLLVRLPPVGPLRALDAGRQLCPDHARGRMTWQQWLGTQVARSGEAKG